MHGYVSLLQRIFSCGCEIGFGSCSVSLDQGLVNCSLKLKMKLSTSTRNSHYLTKKRKSIKMQYHKEFLVDLKRFLHQLLKILVYKRMYVCYYGETYERHLLCQRVFCLCLCVDQLSNLNVVYFYYTCNLIYLLRIKSLKKIYYPPLKTQLFFHMFHVFDWTTSILVTSKNTAANFRDHFLEGISLDV